MMDANKVEISIEDLVLAWKEIAQKKDEDLALNATVLKTYQKTVASLQEEIYELKLTIQELKGETVEESE